MARTSTTTETAKPARVRRSPQEKAEQTLAQAQKRYDKAVAKREKVTADIAALDTEVAEAARFLDFAKGSQHLPQNEVATAPVEDEDQQTV